jgi:flagellar basal-body rod protein FlgB
LAERGRKEGAKLTLAHFSGVSAVDVLAVSLRLLERNNRLIANNIANIDTPNFRPSHIDFQESLRLALRQTGGGAGHRGLRVVMEEDGLESRNDGNYVDIETEMMLLAENTNKYTIYASLLKKKFDITKKMLTTLR